MVDLTGDVMAEGRLCAEPSPIPIYIGIEAATRTLQWLRGADALICTNTGLHAARGRPCKTGRTGYDSGHVKVVSCVVARCLRCDWKAR